MIKINHPHTSHCDYSANFLWHGDIKIEKHVIYNYFKILITIKNSAILVFLIIFYHGPIIK